MLRFNTYKTFNVHTRSIICSSEVGSIIRWPDSSFRDFVFGRFRIMYSLYHVFAVYKK